VVPSEWRKNESFLGMLYAAVLQGKIQVPNKLVMVMDRDNYTGGSISGCGVVAPVMYSCSMCNYVGDRYYHASMHFQRVHIHNGTPMKRKRKYDFNEETSANGDVIIRKRMKLVDSATSKKKKAQQKQRKQQSQIWARQKKKQEKEAERKRKAEERKKEKKKPVVVPVAYYGDLFEGARKWKEIVEGHCLFDSSTAAAAAEKKERSVEKGFHMRTVDKIEGMGKNVIWKELTTTTTTSKTTSEKVEIGGERQTVEEMPTGCDLFLERRCEEENKNEVEEDEESVLSTFLLMEGRNGGGGNDDLNMEDFCI
jgi:hypothetical protein